MIKRTVRTGRRARRGAGAVEYGLVIALVSAGALVAVSQTGGSIAGLLSGAAGKLNGINAAVQTVEEEPLYAFTSHTFTTCGRSGPTGPTLGQCRSAYSSASWAQDSAFFDQGTHQGFQLWTVPKTGTYRIQAYGAQGGNASGGYPGGLGARLRGDFELAKGDQVTIVVGQRGRSSTNGGGGGGSFVWQDGRGNPPMLVAGGGGGAAYYRNDSVNDAVAAENAPSSDCSGSGTNGQGGPYHYSNAGAGAGWLSDGAGGSYGGDSDTLRGADWSSYDGGFGGGGSGDSNVNQGSGGGGGYSGGSSGCNYRDAGAGGGSYNAGANPSNASAARTGHGQVEIQFLGG